MASGYVHTVYKGGQWTNEVEGGEAQTLGKFDTKEMAVAAGPQAVRSTARPST